MANRLALVPSALGTSVLRDAELVEIALDVLDQLEVGIARGGVERHETLQHLDRGRGLGTHAGTVACRAAEGQEPDFAAKSEALLV